MYATNTLLDDMLASYERIPLPELDTLTPETSDIALRADAWVKTRQHRFLLFEAENIAGAVSGTAEFEDVTIDGVQGQLRRSAKLGRVQVGAVLRLGDQVIPTLRVGVGAKGVSQDSELETAGGPVPVLDSSLEVTGGFYVGGGLDIRLGSGFMAGLGLTFVDLGGQRSLESSSRLEYGLGS